MPLIVRMFNRFIHFRWARSTASYVIKLRDFRRLFEVDKKMSDDNPSNDSASDNKPHFELYIKVCTQNLKISKSANTAWGFGACFFASDISERILQMFIFCNIHNYLNTHWNNRLLHILLLSQFFVWPLPRTSVVLNFLTSHRHRTVQCNIGHRHRWLSN